MSDLKAVHGGRFYEAIGWDFSQIDAHGDIVAADVLDAWYPPAPGVVEKIRANLEWLIRTSPPTHAEGLRNAVARARGLSHRHVLLGAGTSSLMFSVLPRLIDSSSRVLVLDPSYGEYEHIIRHLMGAELEKFELPLETFVVDLDEFSERAHLADLAIIVNPNSPTGRGIAANDLKSVIAENSRSTFWVDETYIDFFSIESGEEESLEPWVGELPNLIVSKSMSKFYGLSGLRIGYLAANQMKIREWELFSPPWSVGMMAQIAAIEALADAGYYRERVRETAGMRKRMSRHLMDLGISVVPSMTNFILLRLPRPEAQEICDACASRGIYLRNCDSMSERFQNDTIRIAVQNEDANRRVIEAIAECFD